MGEGFITVPGGKGANQAVAAQRLGGTVAMVGGVGEDAFGASMAQGLAEEGIDVRHVDVRGGWASGVALITVNADGENTIIVVPGANGTLTTDDVHACARRRPVGRRYWCCSSRFRWPSCRPPRRSRTTRAAP